MSRPAPEFAAVTLQDVIVTHDLDRRPAPDGDHARLKRAIQELAVKMAYSAEEVLPRFVDLAMELADGIAAGISIFERDTQPQVFRWAFLRGAFARFEGATTPRDFSPCGITLDDGRPTLARHAERFYSWISDAGIVVPEVLLVPLHRGSDEQLGTLWIVSDRTGHFNRGHAQEITELASFVSIALLMVQTENRLKAALGEQEALAREMSHRVKNVFDIVEGMVRLSAKGASSKDELGEVLTGRIRALGKAHSLVRRGFAAVGQPPVEAADLQALLQAIVSPYDAAPGEASRFSLRGPAVPLGMRATNGLALVFHELATNAVKYGALAGDGGTVGIDWTIADGGLDIRWVERGGPPLAGPPATRGFGTELVRRTTNGLRGTLDHDWNADGLRVRIRVPAASLHH